MRGTRGVLLLALAATLAGCALERTRDLPVIAEDEVSLVVEDDGPWQAVPDAAPETVATRSEEAAPPASAEAPTPVLAAARAPVPQRRTPPPAPASGRARVPADLSRERYLANPTRIVASRITFRCPARYAPEVSRNAERTVEEAPGRTAFVGNARLACRELTLEADRIVLDVRPDAQDVQVTARGDVSFVSEQHGQVLRHEGVKSLLLTNDRVLPLR